MRIVNYYRQYMGAIPTNCRTILLALGSGCLSFLLYWRGTAPTVATIFDDSLEFPLVVQRLAIAHPTGYPLYILLGKLFSLFDPTNVAYQLNLLSAVCGGLAVAATYLVGITLVKRDISSPSRSPAYQAGAVSGAFLFGMGPIFYSQATIAEVYTLNAFFVALTLLLALRRRWLGLSFVLGLSLTHHRTIVLLWPALLLYIWLDYRLTPRRNDNFPPWWQIALAFAGPLLIYLYLPLRGQVGSLDGSYQPTLAGFWQYVSGGSYGVFLADNPFGHERTAAFYTSLVSGELHWWGLALALLGGVTLILRRQWPGLVLTGLALLTWLAFNLSYAVSDIAVFFIPCFLLLGVWAGLGWGALLARLWGRWPWLAVGLAIAGLVWLVAGQADQSRADDWAVYDYGHDILAQPLPPNSAIVGILGEMTLIRYFQEVNDLRPDLQTYPADREAERLAQVERLLAAEPERAVYLLGMLPGAPQRWSLSALGPLIRVQPQPLTSPPTLDAQTNIPLSPEISLAGYRISRPPTHQALDPVRLTVAWQARAAVPGDWKISARLLDEAGAAVAVNDRVPVHFAYPTSAWRSGEYIRDVYDLPLPPDLPAGSYTPLLILYDPAVNAAELGRVVLPPYYVAR